MIEHPDRSCDELGHPQRRADAKELRHQFATIIENRVAGTSASPEARALVADSPAEPCQRSVQERADKVRR